MQVIIWFPANSTFDTVQSCAVGAVSLDDAVGQQGLFGFSSNVENWEMGLPIMKTSKVLELPLQQNQGWLEGAWCCCWTFSEMGRRSSLQLFGYLQGIGYPTFTAAFLGDIPPSRQKLLSFQNSPPLWRSYNYPSLSLSNEGLCWGAKMSIRRGFPVWACSGLLPQSGACVFGSQVGSSGTCSLKLRTTWLFAL